MNIIKIEINNEFVDFGYGVIKESPEESPLKSLEVVMTGSSPSKSIIKNIDDLKILVIGCAVKGGLILGEFVCTSYFKGKLNLYDLTLSSTGPVNFL